VPLDARSLDCLRGQDSNGRFLLRFSELHTEEGLHLLCQRCRQSGERAASAWPRCKLRARGPCGIAMRCVRAADTGHRTDTLRGHFDGRSSISSVNRVASRSHCVVVYETPRTRSGTDPVGAVQRPRCLSIGAQPTEATSESSKLNRFLAALSERHLPVNTCANPSANLALFLKYREDSVLLVVSISASSASLALAGRPAISSRKLSHGSRGAR